MFKLQGKAGSFRVIPHNQHKIQGPASIIYIYFMIMVFVCVIISAYFVYRLNILKAISNNLCEGVFNRLSLVTLNVLGHIFILFFLLEMLLPSAGCCPLTIKANFH